MKTKKRILSILMAICMLIGIVPLSAFAAENEHTVLEGKTATVGGVEISALYGDLSYTFENNILVVTSGEATFTLKEGRAIDLGISDDNGGVFSNSYLASSGNVEIIMTDEHIRLVLETNEVLTVNKTEDFAGYTYTCSEGTIELTYDLFYADDGMIHSGSNSNGTLTITGQGGGNTDVFCGFALTETNGSATFMLDGSDETLIDGAISRVKDEPQIISLKTGTVKNLYSPDDIYDYSILLYLNQDIVFSLSSKFIISCENYTVTDIYWENDPNNYITAAVFNMPGNTWLNYQDKTIYAQSDAYVTFVYYGDSGYMIYAGDLYPENQVHFDGTNDAVVGKEHETETYKGLTVTGNPDGIHTAQCNCEELCEYANWYCSICSFGANCCQYGKAEKETLLLIDKAGLYTISGSGENVSILVSNSRNTTLVLNNVSITAPEGLSAIAAQGPLTLLVNGTNTITGGCYDYAALDLRSPCIIANESTGGVLNVNGAEYTDKGRISYANAIYSDCDLAINNATINATGATGVFMFDDEECDLTIGKNGVLNAIGVTHAGIYEAAVTVENGGKLSAAGGEKQPLAISSDSPVFAGDLILGDSDADDFDGANAELKQFTVSVSNDGITTVNNVDGANYVSADGGAIFVKISDGDFTVDGSGVLDHKDFYLSTLKAAAGETVTVTPKPVTDMMLDKIVVKKIDGDEIAVTDNDNGTYSFQRSAAAISVQVTFKTQTYDVIIPENNGGKIETDKEAPVKGDKVTVTVTPDLGKEIDKVVVKDKDGRQIEVTENPDGTYSYIQPASDATIEIIFKDQNASNTDKPATDDPNSISPNTGDNSNIWLWFALLFVSGTGIFAITVYDRKRKAASK